LEKITILFSNEAGEQLGVFNANINHSETAETIWCLLPISYRICYWGDSLWVQLPIPTVENNEEDLTVKEGEIVYWPLGKQIQIFYGKTPISKSEQPETFGPVVKIGGLIEKPSDFKAFLKTIPRRFTYITFKK